MKSRLNFLACSALWVRMLFYNVPCQFRESCGAAQSASRLVRNVEHADVFQIFSTLDVWEASGPRRGAARLTSLNPSHTYLSIAAHLIWGSCCREANFHRFISDLGHFHLWFWIKCRSDFWHFHLICDLSLNRRRPEVRVQCDIFTILHHFS